MKHLDKILSQNNFGTKSPFFVVYSKIRFPIDPQFSDQTPVYVNYSFGEAEEMLEEDYEKMSESYEGWCNSARMEVDGTWSIGPPQWNDADFDPKEWTEVQYKEVNEFKQVFFTYAAAEEYIEKNKHNLRLPFIDCDSFYRNPEMESVREMLIGKARKERDIEVTV